MANTTRTVNKASRSKKSQASQGDTPKRPGPAPRFTNAQIIEALRLSAGIITGAADILKTSRQTVAKYIENSEELQQALEQVNHRTLDIAESKLMSAINSGNLTATIFYLKTKGKSRGYTERSELSGAGGGAIKIVFDDDDSKL
ncbi:hypothetical protein [Hyphomicrobium sp.]|uniref:hypothetical protein n=1 Tax=Hyphomicrobium sp. TaxID=82 RepID=UPI001E0189B3|nr:hypothetical protein [Hyphomicrobium sp.]MBY0562446.1 hypothetical protein [Hyphomicrobium sp.]